MFKQLNAAILTTLLISQPALGQITRQWVIIGRDEDTTLYVDNNSFKGEGNYRVVWTREDKNQDIYRTSKVYVDCGINRIGVISQAEYNSQGDIIRSFTSVLENYPDGGLIEILPDSKGEAIFNYVCNKVKRAPTQSTQFPKLELGASGEPVKLIQNRLRRLGFFKEESTGYFGELTKQAVIRFQSSKGITADGVVGQQTWRELMK